MVGLGAKEILGERGSVLFVVEICVTNGVSETKQGEDCGYLIGTNV